MDLQRRATVIGLLFIAAAVFAIVGGLAYTPIVDNPDYVTDGPTMEIQIVFGALFELLTAVAVAGTALVFYPVLKHRDESVALGYLAFRLFEGVLIVVGAISMLTILALRQEVAAGAVTDPTALQAVDTALLSVHSLSMVIGINFFLGVNTALYSSVLYRARLVPRPLATLGLVAAASVTLAGVLALFGVIAQTGVWGILLALPIFAYEMSLAVWLITKGFSNAEALFEAEGARASVGTE